MAEGAVTSSRRPRARRSGATPEAAGSLTAVASRAVTDAGAPGGRSLPSVNRRSFRLPEVVLGVFLVAGCALGAVLWQKSADTTTTVVVAGRRISRGSVIGAGDLRGAQVGGETSAMIAGQSAHALLGKIAVIDIDVDVPITPTLLTDARPLAIDEALTSMALAPGHLPPDLATNDTIRIVVTGPSAAVGGSGGSGGSSGSGGTGGSGATGGGGAIDVTLLLDQPAVVWSVDKSPDGVSTIVTLRGSLSLSTAIAAADEIRLVRVGES
jgi:uncharacterized membrane protein YgcG